MRQIRKFKKVSAAAVIGRLRNEFIQKEWDNPFDEHFSEAKQEFLDSNPIKRRQRTFTRRIKLDHIIAHTKEFPLD